MLVRNSTVAFVLEALQVETLEAGPRRWPLSRELFGFVASVYDGDQRIHQFIVDDTEFASQLRSNELI
jgi:hypothetical protein